MDESRWKAFTDNELAALIAAYRVAINGGAADEDAGLWMEMLREGLRRRIGINQYKPPVPLAPWRKG